MDRDRLLRPVRPSPRFERFLASRAAGVVAALMVAAAVVGGGIQLWRTHWLDGSVTIALGLTIGVFVAMRLERSRAGGPSHR